MHCPGCNSQDVQRIEMVFNAGTSESRASFLGIGGGGELVGGSTGGISRTKLAQQLAPPRMIDTGADGLAMIIAVIGVTAALIWVVSLVVSMVTARPVEINQGQVPHGSDFHVGANLGGAAVLAVASAIVGWIGLRSYRKSMAHNRTVPELRGQWKLQWICLRCGMKFQPDATSRS